MSRFVILLFLTMPAALPAQAVPETASSLEQSFVDIAAKAKPAVVNLSVVQEQRVQVQSPYFFFGDPEDMMREFMEGGRPRTYRFRSEGMGSGFIIDPKGYVITNDHVVGNAAAIRVTVTRANGKDKNYPAKVVGRDPALDLAVVKIQADEEFPALKFTDTPPRVGQWVLAIGSPFTLEQTVTAGIISAERQSLLIEDRRYPDMLQTDAAINRGNSGGPLLNLRGEVVGVNTAIYSPSGGSAGVGFAIPASSIKPVLSSLIAGKKTSRGWLGIETVAIDAVAQRRFALPSPEGALVNRLFRKSPAMKAGLKRGDVIRRLDDAAISSPEDLIHAVSRLEAGKKVVLQFYRKGVPNNVSLTLSERPGWADRQQGTYPDPSAFEEDVPEGDPQEDAFAWEGVTFIQAREGISVARISPDSKLNGSLLPGDIIRSVNENEISGLDQLRAALKKVKLSEGIFLDLLREGQPLYLSVK